MTQKSAGLTPALRDYLPLLSELGDLKRVQAAHIEGSLASNLFRRSWASLVGDARTSETALATTAAALCAARLGATDGRVLASGGLSAEETRTVLLAGFDAVSSPLPEPLRGNLRRSVGEAGAGRSAGVPDFVSALELQPRAGATRPGRPRLMLEPPESHAEHCMTVAIYGVVLSSAFGAEPGLVFAAGLSHHLHNAGLPDSGFAGEELLGGHFEKIVGRFRESALAELEDTLREEAEESLKLTEHTGSPEARAFHAADVLDRVLQMRHYEKQAEFTLDQALGEMDLVHPGPFKDFQDAVLSGTGLL